MSMFYFGSQSVGQIIHHYTNHYNTVEKFQKMSPDLTQHQRDIIFDYAPSASSLEEIIEIFSYLFEDIDGFDGTPASIPDKQRIQIVRVYKSYMAFIKSIIVEYLMHCDPNGALEWIHDRDALKG